MFASGGDYTILGDYELSVKLQKVVGDDNTKQWDIRNLGSHLHILVWLCDLLSITKILRRHT